VRKRPIRCKASGHYSVPKVEGYVEGLYATLRFSPTIIEQIRAELRDELADRAGLVERQAKGHERTLKKIAAKQEKLVQLFYDDLVDRKVFEGEQIKLKAEAKAAERLRRVAIVQSESAEQALDEAIERMSDIERIYREGTPIERRILNRAIFKRIEIGEDGEITEASLTPTYEALSAWTPTLGKPTTVQSKDREPRRSSFVRPTADRADTFVVRAQAGTRGNSREDMGLAVGCSRLFPAVPGTRDRKRTAGTALRSFCVPSDLASYGHVGRLSLPLECRGNSSASRAHGT
jgi:hypothetical protein